MSFVVRGIAFHDDGMTVDYVVPEEDIRANGLIQNRVLLIPAIEEYSDLFDGLIDAIHAALGRAVADFAITPVSEEADEFDNDDTSPYDNPNERALPTPVQPAQEGDRP